VRITDRGPFVGRRIIDLSFAAARDIDMVAAGVVRVHRVRTLCLPSTLSPCADTVFAAGDGTADCGGAGLEPPAATPFAGAIYDDPVGGTKLADLGLGCLHYGGGDSEYAPSPRASGGSSMVFGGATCSLPVVPLVASAGTGPLDCTEGPSSKRLCVGNPSRTCTRDRDCGGGACSPLPRCFWGLPLPVHGPAPSCVINVFAADGGGSINPTSGEARIETLLTNYAYVTLDDAAPCPRCVSGTCVGGQRAGRACSAGAPDGRSHDCPPRDDQFYAALNFQAAGDQAVATETRTAAAADGRFCPDQRTPGAFGKPTARRIVEIGSPAGDLSDHAPHAVILSGTSCISSSGVGAVDQVADLPGPAGVSMVGTMRFTDAPR